ncbi:MAG: orotidine 5'-phosphate decarboxylase [Clostridium sp.]|nr:orotidine 5'-phosphate decarboxylase [Clostridium sp.]
MRIQVAIDRVSLEKADEIIRLTGRYADIIEIGTSLIKDFGLSGSVKMLRDKYPGQRILADMKTCDEGEYEFRKAYAAGCDIPTVMGFSSLATLKACQKVAQEYQKEYMIDLLEVSEEKLAELKKQFSEAIFCLHLPSDKQGDGLQELVGHMCGQLEGIDKIAVAGGVTLDTLDMMKRAGVDIVIVGGAITRQRDIAEAARKFAEAIR